MTTQDTNPFASPETAFEREKVELLAMPPTFPLEPQRWPYEASELAEIEELPKPSGRSVSVSRKWGHGRWLGVFLLTSFVAYFSFVVCTSIFYTILDTATAAELWALVVTGIFIVCFAIPYALYNIREDIYDRRSLLKLIRKRSDAIGPTPVTDDPAFVVLVPRPRWVFSRNLMTAYVAFAHIDREAKRIFLDGDKFRIRIPVNSLLDISVESLPKGSTTLWFVRLVIQTQTGPHELCFRLGNTSSLWQTDGQRKADAEEYRNRILLLKNSA